MSDERKVEVSGIGGMGWLVIVWWLCWMTYDAEIRCALGNKVACEKAEQATPINKKAAP